jgi:hypothetical protein
LEVDDFVGNTEVEQASALSLKGEVSSGTRVHIEHPNPRAIEKRLTAESCRVANRQSHRDRNEVGLDLLAVLEGSAKKVSRLRP